MKIITYKTMLNEAKLTTLVKESSIEYMKEVKCFNSPESISELMNTLFQADKKAEEYVWLLAFDAAFHVVGVFEVSHGAVNYSVISPREIFIRLCLCGATNFIICHNHPSGDINPSYDDIEVTERAKEAGDMMKIPLIDHIILGERSYYSFKENGRI